MHLTRLAPRAVDPAMAPRSRAPDPKRDDARDNEPGEPPPPEFAHAVAALLPRLQRYAARLTRDSTVADDLVQNACLRALRKWRLWQPGSDLRAWLFTLLHNQHVNDVRRSARRGPHVPLDDVEPPSVVPRLDGGLRTRDLDRTSSRLSPEMKQVLLLVGLDGLRLDEVARVIGAPVGTVRSRLSRAREAVAEALDDRSLRRKRPGGGSVAR